MGTAGCEIKMEFEMCEILYRSCLIISLFVLPYPLHFLLERLYLAVSEIVDRMKERSVSLRNELLCFITKDSKELKDYLGLSRTMKP